MSNVRPIGGTPKEAYDLYMLGFWDGATERERDKPRRVHPYHYGYDYGMHCLLKAREAARIASGYAARLCIDCGENNAEYRPGADGVWEIRCPDCGAVFGEANYQDKDE